MEKKYCRKKNKKLKGESINKNMADFYPKSMVTYSLALNQGNKLKSNPEKPKYFFEICDIQTTKQAMQLKKGKSGRDRSL